jgi:hypothetical protein
MLGGHKNGDHQESHEDAENPIHAGASRYTSFIA